MTQNQRLIEYMTEHGSITPLEAMTELGIMRLASRISDIKAMGYIIDSEMITVKNRFGEDCTVKQYKILKKI